jgi:flagellar basal-body rod protein FlgB
MSQVQLLNLAAQKIEWLSTRQEILAQNVANVNTPRYLAKDVVQFEAFLDNAGLNMAKSNPLHMDASASVASQTNTVVDREGEKNYSGNNVSLENELLKLGETNSQFALNTGLIKSYNRMLMASLKG